MKFGYLLLLTCLAAPVALWAQTGSLTYADGHREENVLMNISSLVEPDQKIFIRQAGKWVTLVPANLERMIFGADTFVTVRLNGSPPAMLRTAVHGHLRLYLAEESFLHSFLIRYQGDSPLDPLATNAERVYTKADTNYGNLVPVLAWPDGSYLVLNPVDKATLHQKINGFLETYPEPLPPLNNRLRRVPNEYFIKLVQSYNQWATKKENSENTKMKDKF